MPSLGKIFTKADTHPLVLDVGMFQIFSSEWLAWDPDDTVEAVDRHFGTPTSKQSRMKLYALSVLHSNHAYWEDWRAFEAVSWGLSGKQVDLVEATPLQVTPLIYGLRISKLLDSKSKFGDDVNAYILSVFLHNQFSLLPPDVSYLQDVLFDRRPDLRTRADMVKSAILSGGQAELSDVSEDPVKVELTRHKVLEAMMHMVNSNDHIMGQARSYGLGRMLGPVLQGVI